VVGEPTNLDFAVAQRGLMMVDLLARGVQRHAGYAADDGEFTNAVVSLSQDIVRLVASFGTGPIRRSGVRPQLQPCWRAASAGT
jgi:hypothetical protein